MKLNDEYHNILRYTRRLKVKSYDLRSKLTALVLFTEESENLSQDQTASSQLCRVIPWRSTGSRDTQTAQS